MGLFNNVGRYSDVHEYIRNFQQQTQSGLKLDVNNNYDIRGKRLANVGQGVDDDDAVVMRQFATNNSILTAKVVQLRADSLQVDGSSHMTGDLDLRGQKLIKPGEIDMNRKMIKNLGVDESDDLSAVNMATLKKHSASAGNIDLQEKYNVLNSKKRVLNELKTHYDSLVSYEEVKENFLSRVETFTMGTTLDMNLNPIINLKDPTLGKEPATKDYADEKLSKAGGRMTGSINMGIHEITNLATPTGNSNAATKKYVDDVDAKVSNKIDIGEIDQKTKKIINLGAPTSTSDAATKGYVDSAVFTGDMQGNAIVNLKNPVNSQDAATKDFVEKSHVSQSGLQQNVFLYQMLDVNESSSESNITVTGINNFSNTPHTIFKKAYQFTIGKDAQNEYDARIGFNFFRVPTGAYTYVVEYFPHYMVDVSVDCLSTSLNVNKQIFKKFPNYVKNIAQIHKWQMATPCYLMIDLKMKGGAATPQSVDGWLIVYGITGTHNNVSSSVLDAVYTITNGNMLMQAPINMNRKTIKNLPLPTSASQAASKAYVDGSRISILQHATATFVDAYIKENAECLYFVDRGTKDELIIMSSSTRSISTLFDKSLSGINARQNNIVNRPKLSTSKNARRYFITFDGNKRMIANVNLNTVAGKRDTFHAFILFRLSTFAGTNRILRNGLFGNDNGGWDRMVIYSAHAGNNLIIGGAVKDKSEAYGGNNVQVKAADWKSKANATALGIWICLSVHWDVPGGSGASSVWVNGKKVKSFQARAASGQPSMTLGDVYSNETAGLNGDIQFFVLYKEQYMSETIIKAHHKMICERYGVDHDAISFS